MRFFEKVTAAVAVAEEKFSEVKDQVNENLLNGLACDNANKLKHDLLSFQDNVKQAFVKNKQHLIENKVCPGMLEFLRTELWKSEDITSSLNILAANKKVATVFPEKLMEFQQVANTYKKKMTAILFFIKFYSRHQYFSDTHKHAQLCKTKSGDLIKVTLNPIYESNIKKRINFLYERKFTTIYESYLSLREKKDKVNKKINNIDLILSEIERNFRKIVESFEADIQENKRLIIKKLLDIIKNKDNRYSKEREVLYNDLKSIGKMPIDSIDTMYETDSELLDSLYQEFPEPFSSIIDGLFNYYQLCEEKIGLQAECTKIEKEYHNEEKKITANNRYLLGVLLILKTVIARYLTDNEKEELKHINVAKGSVKDFKKSLEPKISLQSHK